ncbi:hypothetical protein HYW44_03255 [Candidatus Daviesbacteria bacterium]|nr:hypothetical protein [Candidatus Daviesbacteria bacterium]
MKKIVIISAFILVLLVLGVFFFLSWKGSGKPNQQINLIPSVKENAPSETFIEYTDPAGFSFSYPDNLSIEKADTEDPNSYADLQIFSKDVNGSIKLRIEDTKLKSVDEWIKSNNIPDTAMSKENKLGNLDAKEVRTTDRLMLGAVDQKILFTIEVPLVEEKFWMKVYEKILSEFSFVTPEANNASSGSNSYQSDVIFEGEEVVE